MFTQPKQLVELLESPSLESEKVEKIDEPADNETDDWEEGSLPGSLTVHFFTKQDFPNPISQPQNQGSAAPFRSRNQQALHVHQYNPRTKARPGRFDSSGSSPNTRDEQTPYRPEIGGIISRQRGIQTRQVQHRGGHVDNAAYASYLRGEQPGGKYIFSQDWCHLLSDLHAARTRERAREELDRLSRQTSTFIATPPDHSKKAEIWGDSTQVTYACNGLEEFEKSIHKELAEKRRDFGRWERINALDGRKEHREERKAKIEEIVAQHGKLESSAGHDFEYWLLWPSQDLEFEQISTTKLQNLRKNFWCVIDYDSKTSFVRILAHDERSLLQCVQRIVNLVKEMIAELNQVQKVNLVELPSKCAPGSCVSLEGENSIPVISTPQGQGISMVEAESWGDLPSRRSNRKDIGKAIERCLKGLRLSEKHVRMRVSFGQLALKKYQLPQHGSKQYHLEEFCAMIKNDRTLLGFHDLPCGAGTDALVDRCASHPMFLDPTETYAVHIDFKEPNTHTTLRLEKRFTVSQDYRDVFLSGHYWLEFPSGSEGSLLEINMLDFAHLDWRMTINAASFSETAKRSSQHDHFQTNVELQPTSDDMQGKPKLQGKPQRRITFRLDGPKPTMVTELITVVYNIRHSDAKFELTRRDEYQQTQYGTEAGPPVSTLFASYYYPQWDNDLGKYAYLPPGEQVDWQPSLSTFFPVEGGEGKDKGVKKFMEEIRRIQQAVAGKAAEADDSHVASMSTKVSNGVGNTEP